MVKVDQVTALTDGASFFRGDLHIHSFGHSHDVKDQAMTPSAIVTKAIAEGLSLISLTDHNEISGVAEALQAAAGTSLCVIPGVELSTSDGHLLCYLPDIQRLQQFHGKITLADQGTTNSRCKTALLDCITLADSLGGFCMLAHVDGAKGFEMEVPGSAPHKVDVMKHKGLLGIELKDNTTPVSYSPQDPDSGRKQIGTQRAAALGLGVRQFLARVVSSDAHMLANVGLNSNGQSRVTRYKMQTPSFLGLRLALLDAEVRVRIEDEIPFAVPHVLGMHLEGGFFSGTTIRLSKNLNCIIGGRGAGKSTTLEAIRLLSADGGQAYMLDSEVWPSEIDLFWRDAAGVVTALNRVTGGDVQNVSDPLDGPTEFDMDCFGQGDAATISKSAEKDPMGLMRYLDKFIDLTTAKSEETLAREELLASQQAIEKAKQQVAMIPTWDQRLKVANAQLTALETAKAKEVTTKFFQVLKASADDADVELRAVVPDDQYRAAFINLARNLAPSGSSFDRLEIRDASNPSEPLVTLASETRSVLNKELRKLKPGSEQSSDEPLRIPGVLRAVHLDKDWLELISSAEPNSSIHVSEAGDALDDVVGPMVNRPVVVSVVKRGDKYIFRDIELAD